MAIMLHLLLVENNSLLIGIWNKSLKTAFGDHIKVDLAENGFSSLEKIKLGASYDIILMSTKISNINDCTTAKEIKNLGYPHPIIAHTSFLFKEVQDAIIKGSLDGFLIKSKTGKNLVHFIKQYIHAKQKHFTSY